MTQKELAMKSGTTEASVSHYITGDRKPRAVVLAKIADVLGTSSDFLMYGKAGDSSAEIDQAVRLIARNASQLNHEEKMRIISILLGDK